MVDSWEVWADDFKPFHTDHMAIILSGLAMTLLKVVIVLVGCRCTTSLFLVGNFEYLNASNFVEWTFKAQAEMIRQTTLRYYVTYIGIDITGMGTGVSQLVKQFFPNVTEFSYSPEVKHGLS
jgi:hypothetical protein